MSRAFVRVAAGLVGMLLLLLATGWLLRFRVAGHFMDRHLAAAGVPASYQITRIGPYLQRIEGLRLGDPAAPDLLANRVDVVLGYGLAGPYVRSISAEGVRIRARIDASGLHLGAIDRLLPQNSGGERRLPDIDLAIADARAELATPAGAMTVSFEGRGNPQGSFDGRAQLAAPSFRAASCSLSALAADLRLTARKGNPRAEGTVHVASTRCPQLRLGAGTARIAVESDKTLSRISGDGALAGFGGHVGPARFAHLSGTVAADGALGALAVKAGIRLAGLGFPETADGIASSVQALGGTPVGPTAMRAAAAAARLLRRSEAVLEITAAIRDGEATVALRRADLSGDNGGHIAVRARGGIGWDRAGWRADGDVAMGGGELPAIRAEVRQAHADAPISGTVQMDAYQAGDARLTVTPLRFSWASRRAGFDTRLRIDGPVGDGFVTGLSLPLSGHISPDGALVLDQGCHDVGFTQMRIASWVLDPAQVRLCGAPIVARSATGQVRIDLAGGPVRIAGRTSEGAPLRLNVARVRLSGPRIEARGVEAALGDDAGPTRLSVAAIDGRLAGGGASGSFRNAAGGLANVPLALSDARGNWSVASGALRLTGSLRLADAALTPRFHPLTADEIALRLAEGAVRANAILREPDSGLEIARVALTHDLSEGSGRASLDVPGIAFRLDGLQPEKLTPLTLGVIANVEGRVTGRGEIGWTPNGVTSSGTFATERLDLAAPFGPVSGIVGEIRFSDLLELITPPDQRIAVAEINPGVPVTNGVVRYHLPGQNRVAVESAEWPFAGGTLRLDPTILDFATEAARYMTFRLEKVDAATFVQQLDFPNISATGTFDGVLPMMFDQRDGQILGGSISARATGGTLAYIGDVSNADMGAAGELAFDALKAIRYSALDISLDGRIDGEMISRVRFTGVREATPEQSFVSRLIRGLPFRFNIEVRAPFRALVGTAQAYADPRLLLRPRPKPVQPEESEPVQ